MDAYLPFIAAVIVAAITAYANFRVGNFKNRVDSKSLVNDENKALRDDLLSLIDRYETREKALVDKNEKLETLVSGLKEEMSALRIQNRELTAEVQQLRRELNAFERKVYYVPPHNQVGEKE